MSIPIIKIEVEHMRQSIAHAFTDWQLKQDEIFNQVLREVCTPENLRRIMADGVNTQVEAAIKEEVRAFYAHGNGRAVIRKAVEAKLSEDLP